MGERDAFMAKSATESGTPSRPADDRRPPLGTRVDVSEDSTVCGRIAGFLVRARWPLFAGALVVAAAAWPISRRLEFDRSIDNMFSPTERILQDFHRFRDRFGGDQILLIVYEDARLFAPEGDGLRRCRDATRAARRVPGVLAVLSPSVLDTLLKGLGTSMVDATSRLARRFRGLFEGYTHGADGKVASVVCILDEKFVNEHGTAGTIDGLRSIAAGLDAGVLVGEPVMVHDSFEYVEEDARRLSWVSTCLLGATILAVLRSARWALVALAVVHWTLLATEAVLHSSGLRLSMVSSMLTAVVTVIGVATVMHVAIGFRDRRQLGAAPADALRCAIGRLATPIFWACVTDAAGFLALLAARAGPIRDFGLMMACGSMIVLLASALLIPAMALVGHASAPARGPSAASRLDRALGALFDLVQRRAGWVAACVLAAVAVSVIGGARLDVETDFTRNFRSGSPIARAYAFVEDRLGGAGAWDIMVPAPEVLDAAYIDRLLALQERIRALRDPRTGEPALGSVLSLADAIDAGSLHPFLAAMPPELRARGLRAVMPDFLQALRGEDPETGSPWMRVMLRAYDRRDAETKRWLIAEVERIVGETFPEGEDDGRAAVTGFYVLLTHLVAGMLRDQWRCFAAAVVGVGAVMTIALRSVRGALAALVTNGLPIVIALGAVGWAGMKLNMGAAMMAAVSLGLSVDSSLHYLDAFEREWRKERDRVRALAVAQRTVGRALVFATIALAIGFATLGASDFAPTVSFGGLAAATLVGGLLGNLTLLPLLLLFIHRGPAHAPIPGTSPIRRET